MIRHSVVVAVVVVSRSKAIQAIRRGEERERSVSAGRTGGPSTSTTITDYRAGTSAYSESGVANRGRAQLLRGTRESTAASGQERTLEQVSVALAVATQVGQQLVLCVVRLFSRISAQQVVVVMQINRSHGRH